MLYHHSAVKYADIGLLITIIINYHSHSLEHLIGQNEEKYYIKKMCIHLKIT